MMPNETPGEDRKETLSRIIESEIVDGLLMPGERLDERALAERFGISRTPVREALNRLATTGLVEIRRNAGIFVASLTLAEVLELYETVAEIESIVTRLATRRATRAQRDRILELALEFEQWAKHGDIDLFATRNVAFHAAIYEAGPQPLFDAAGGAGAAAGLGLSPDAFSRSGPDGNLNPRAYRVGAGHRPGR